MVILDSFLGENINEMLMVSKICLNYIFLQNFFERTDVYKEKWCVSFDSITLYYSKFEMKTRRS